MSRFSEEAREEFRAGVNSRDKRSRRQPAEEASGQAAAIGQDNTSGDRGRFNLVAILNHSTL